ncbi:hypothetical protein ACFO3I_06265 [Rheinheimera marina]|uniref:Esterase-like activity of phytase family protein n=1 Tax=Rheinheimera marina TaxID=1774958 RepID=A0ABV9JK48_9GAMM
MRLTSAIAGYSLMALMSGCVPTPAAESSLNVQPLPVALGESSALSCEHGSLWSLNDSGNKAEVFQLSFSAQLQRQQALKLTNRDWEALAWAGDVLWLADVGNNDGSRSELQLYGLNRQLKPEQRIRIRMPESSSLPYQHDVDFESLVYWQQQLWLVSKSWKSLTARFYPINSSAPEQSLPQPRYEVTLPFLVTDASAVPGTDQLVLVGYAPPQQRFWQMIQGKFEVWMALLDGEGKLIKQQQLPVDTQVEGACVDPAGQLWLSSEVGYKPASLYRLLHW